MIYFQWTLCAFAGSDGKAPFRDHTFALSAFFGVLVMRTWATFAKTVLQPDGPLSPNDRSIHPWPTRTEQNRHVLWISVLLMDPWALGTYTRDPSEVGTPPMTPQTIHCCLLWICTTSAGCIWYWIWWRLGKCSRHQYHMCNAFRWNRQDDQENNHSL